MSLQARKQKIITMNNNNYPKTLGNRQLLNLGLLLLLFLSVIFLFSLYSSRTIRHYENTKFTSPSPFENIELEAVSALVYDIKNKKIIFERNAYEMRPLASITKVLSVITALDLLPKETIVKIDKNSLLEEGDTGLYKDEKWKLSDLIDYSLTASSNDGISAIAASAGALSGLNNYQDRERDFVDKMNSKARQIGMRNSYFINATGLDLKDGRSGGYSNAYETALLLAYALERYPEILESTTHSSIDIASLSNIRHKASNTNNGIRNISGLVGSKTGFTEMAGGNLAIIIDGGLGRPFVIVALGSSIEGRINDVTSMAQKTFEYLAGGN